MARYIVLRADFDREGAKADDMAMRGLADVSAKVRITPTADVVPRAELAIEATQRVAAEEANRGLLIQLKGAKSEIERLQEEVNRYKRYYFHHDYDKMIAEVLDKLDRFINSNCIEIKDERGIKGYVTSGVHFAIAELKKKYTEGKDEQASIQTDYKEEFKK